jgi:CheY-like chemotaxis protein
MLMNKIPSILLVEDDQLDVIDIRRSLDKLNILYRLTVARNGEEGIARLEELMETDSLPNLILLDINMPRMNGLEFLAVLRSREEWKHLSCFIITTSDEKVDKTTAKNLNVSGYIVKPFKINQFTSIDSFNLMIDLMNMKG